MYIYIYKCVCVCVCTHEYELSKDKLVMIQFGKVYKDSCEKFPGVLNV